MDNCKQLVFFPKISKTFFNKIVGFSYKMGIIEMLFFSMRLNAYSAACQLYVARKLKVAVFHNTNDKIFCNYFPLLVFLFNLLQSTVCADAFMACYVLLCSALAFKCGNNETTIANGNTSSTANST